MRILHISSLYPPGVVGGAEKVVSMLAEGQAEAGHQVGAAYLTQTVQVPGLRNGVAVFPQKTRNLLWIEDVQKHPRHITTANKLSQAANLKAAADFGAVIEAFRPQIVHTHSMVELPPMVWREAKARGAAVVHTLHDYDLLCSRGTLFRHGRVCARPHLACAALGAWKQLFERSIDAVAAVSRPVLERHTGAGLFGRLAPERRKVIWNGVAPRIGARSRGEHRTGEPLVFGFLGRLVPEKGVGLLLEACRRLPAQGWRLRIAGRAPAGTPGFQAEAAGLPVEFLGFTDPAAFLDTIDVLVVPSIWEEPFGLTVVEAYAQGVPVIGADRGAIGELVGRVDPDWVVAPEDPQALARRMRRAINEPLPCPAAFRPVLQATAPARMTEAYGALYEQVATAPQ